MTDVMSRTIPELLGYAEAGFVQLESALSPGDVAGNISLMPRANIFVVFNSVENSVVEPFSGTEPRPGFLAAR